MKQNKYDDASFFIKYEKMPRSVFGLEAAGEWYVFKELLPDLKDKRVLDLGCGFGWHCRYAREQGASSVVGVDISEKMLQRAREQTEGNEIIYIHKPMEEITFQESQFDVVISSLAFHYVEAFDELCQKISMYLKPKGKFIFSVEHPIFTSRDDQDWYYDKKRNRLHWPVDNYQVEGLRNTSFLTDNVMKYHRTIATYMNNLIDAGFSIKGVREPAPSDKMLSEYPEWIDEMRRPMFFIISAEKK